MHPWRMGAVAAVCGLLLTGCGEMSDLDSAHAPPALHITAASAKAHLGVGDSFDLAWFRTFRVASREFVLIAVLKLSPTAHQYTVPGSAHLALFQVQRKNEAVRWTTEWRSQYRTTGTLSQIDKPLTASTATALTIGVPVLAFFGADFITSDDVVLYIPRRGPVAVREYRSLHDGDMVKRSGVIYVTDFYCGFGEYWFAASGAGHYPCIQYSRRGAAVVEHFSISGNTTVISDGPSDFRVAAGTTVAFLPAGGFLKDDADEGYVTMYVSPAQDGVGHSMAATLDSLQYDFRTPGVYDVSICDESNNVCSLVPTATVDVVPSSPAGRYARLLSNLVAAYDDLKAHASMAMPANNQSWPNFQGQWDHDMFFPVDRSVHALARAPGEETDLAMLDGTLGNLQQDLISEWQGEATSVPISVLERQFASELAQARRDATVTSGT